MFTIVSLDQVIAVKRHNGSFQQEWAVRKVIIKYKHVVS
jgi:hypothetical protein